MAREIYIARINRHDVYEFVNDSWVRFSVANGAPNLALHVIGTSFLEHITDETVRHLYRNLVDRVRQSQQPCELPFRCDASHTRRFMRMRLVPQVDGGVEFQSWIEREEPYQRLMALLDPRTPKSADALLRMCSWCKRIHTNQAWIEIDTAVEQLRLFDDILMPQLTHGICDSCFEEVSRM